MHASNSNTCHENVRFVNCLICSTLQLALQNRQYLSTEEFFSPDLVDMNHNPNSPRAKKKLELSDIRYFATRVAKPAISVDWKMLFARFGGYEPYPKIAAGETKQKFTVWRRWKNWGQHYYLTFFFSSFQNVIRNIIYGAARTNITISSDDNTCKIVLIQSSHGRREKSCHVDMISNRHP